MKFLLQTSILYYNVNFIINYYLKRPYGMKLLTFGGISHSPTFIKKHKIVACIVFLFIDITCKVCD